MFSNGRYMTKCHSFLHDDDNDDAKAIAENSRAKNAVDSLFTGCRSYEYYMHKMRPL